MKLAIISVRASSLIDFRGPLIRALVERGVEVLALASDLDESSCKALAALGAKPIDISLSRTGMNPLEDLRDTVRLSRILAQIHPDVSLAYYIKPVVFGTFAAWLARIPHRVVMVEGLGFIFTDTGTTPSPKKRILRAMVSYLYRFSLARAHRVVFLNPDDIDDFDHWRIVRREKSIELGGIGVDLDEWCFEPREQGPVRFLFIGRLLLEKGIHDFVEAARIVKARYPLAQFIVLGDLDSNPGGISRDQMEAWVDEGSVDWMGHVPVKPWLKRCSVFVLPSYREGVPRSSQEAMAVGRPIITTDVPGCRQTVETGVNGFLVPVRDPTALADAMFKLIDNPSLVTEMGTQSRRLAEERFDVHKVNEKLMAILGVE